MQAPGCVLCLHLEAPPANLLAMVGRLAVNNPPLHTQQHEQQQQQQLQQQAAPPTTLNPAPTELDVHALTSTLQAQQQQQRARAAAAMVVPAGSAGGSAEVQESVQGATTHTRRDSASAAATSGGGQQEGSGAGEYMLQDLRAMQGLTHPLDAMPLQVRVVIK